MKWEYLIVDQDHHNEATHGVTLNRLGDAGWELVSVAQQFTADRCYERKLFLKRPVAAAPELDVPIENLGLGTKTRLLQEAGIDTVKQLLRMSEADLLGIRNMGERTVRNIVHILKVHGLRLRMETGPLPIPVMPDAESTISPSAFSH